MQHCNDVLLTMTMQIQPSMSRVPSSWMMLIFVPGLLGVGKMGLLISFTWRLSPPQPWLDLLIFSLFLFTGSWYLLATLNEPRLHSGVSITDRKKVCGVLKGKARWLILDICVIKLVNITYQLPVWHFFHNLQIEREFWPLFVSVEISIRS